MSYCRSCGQPIDWVKTTKGKNMPVEGDYIFYDDLSAGEIIITDGGNLYTKKKDDSAPSVRGRISHFAICPQADEWRKEK